MPVVVVLTARETIYPMRMDVWEHAYMVDFGAGGRAAYIKAFFSNVNWPVVERRFTEASARRSPRAF